jgi:hypothetical protein
MHRKLIWLPLGIVLTAALVASMHYLATAQSRKTVVLEMSWSRGDPHYGPNFIHLESDCLGTGESDCFCSVDFKVTTSKEFANYIESFGSKKVPVKYQVDYDRDHAIIGAGLESVGEWPTTRFHINETSLAIGFRFHRQAYKVHHFHDPGDCFPKPPH